MTDQIEELREKVLDAINTSYEEALDNGLIDRGEPALSADAAIIAVLDGVSGFKRVPTVDHETGVPLSFREIIDALKAQIEAPKYPPQDARDAQ